jgi:hypothetical protein
MVRVVSVRPMEFWDLQCRFAVEVVVGGRDGCVVGVVEVVGGGFDYAVVVGSWRWADDGYGRMGLLVSTLVGEGYQ